MGDVFKNLPNAKQQDDESLPDELKGKSPGEIYQMLQQEHNRVLEEEIEKVKTQQPQGQEGQQNDPLTTPDYSQYSTGTGQNQYNTGTTQQQYSQYSGAGYTPPQEEDEEEPIPGMSSFMEKQLNKRVGPIVQQTVSSMRAQNRNYLISQIGKEEWDKWGNEIEQIVSGMSPQIQMDPRAYQQAYKFVQANHLDEIAAERAKQLAEQQRQAQAEEEEYEPEPEPKKSLFQSNIGVQPTAPHVGKPNQQGTTQRRKKPKLTDEELKIARAFDMSEEEYVEYRGQNTDTVTTLGFAGGE